MALLGKVVEAGEALPPDTPVGWTARTMKVSQFGEHMREELVLHGWDVTGDDPTVQARLGEAWMTDHSVFAVGIPLLAKGAKQLGLAMNRSRLGCEYLRPTMWYLPLTRTARRSN